MLKVEWQPLRGSADITRDAGPHRAITIYTGLRIHVYTEKGEFRFCIYANDAYHLEIFTR